MRALRTRAVSLSCSVWVAYLRFGDANLAQLLRR
jgi:hypothetical protein